MYMNQLRFKYILHLTILDSTAGEILMPQYIISDNEMSIQWDGFQSEVDMMLYYVAVSDSSAAETEDCKQLVSSHN